MYYLKWGGVAISTELQAKPIFMTSEGGSKFFSEKKWGRGRKTILGIGNLFQAYLFLGKDDPRF